MNKNIAQPLIIRLSNEPNMSHVGQRITMPVTFNYKQFEYELETSMLSCDSVLLSLDDTIDMMDKNVAKNITIKTNTIKKLANEQDVPVLSKYDDGVWYWMNPPMNEQTASHGYAPSDDIILAKYNQYGGESEWQKHQSEVWQRMAGTMPLATGAWSGESDHVKTLTSPSRGLETKDIRDFWSWKSGQMLLPSMFKDDMLGMPSIKGNDYDGFTMTPATGPNKGNNIPMAVRSLKTIGMSGIMIPMKNAEGYCTKYQIATDISPINVVLKARAVNGVSIQTSEILNKKTNEYNFLLNTQPSHLHVGYTSLAFNTITFSDIKGDFNVSMKDDIHNTLIERGYQLPKLINSLKVEPRAKYIWQSKGTMIGSDNIAKTVSPSNAGFIVAREPKETNQKQDYVVVVVEGALKGHIASKYMNSVDKNNQSFGDFIARDSGIIVAQVPGVSKAFVESVKPIYDQYNVKGTYIAMDADGRENLSVARGIHAAVGTLSEKSNVKVISWNPEHKGLDDALLAVANNKISLSEMGVHFGTPENLFPLDKASAPNPYKLDGTRANRQNWMMDYDTSKKETEQVIVKTQRETQQRAQALLDNASTLADNLPKEEKEKEIMR